MNHTEIKKFLSEFESKRERTIVIIDYGNVDKWKQSLGWEVSIRHIGQYSYDTIILFSGDGDLMYATKYLKDEYGKGCYAFGARGHVGREVMDAKNTGNITDIFYVEDFEYRLNQNYEINRH